MDEEVPTEATTRRRPLHHEPLTGEERDRLRALRAATEANADQYAAILSVFAEARERYEIELRTDQIAAGLTASGLPTEGIEAQLRQLDEWGNLTWTQDTARVARLEDFRRRRAIWQLTAAGQAAHDAIAAVLGASDSAGSLQRTLFRDIRGNLAALGQAVDEGDAESVYLRLRDLDGSLRDLAANARDFHAAVAQLRREHDVDPDRFLAYKHLLIDYLDQFLEHLLTQRTLISADVEAVSARGVDRLVELAGAGDDSAGMFATVDLAANWRARWDGLAGWFAARSDGPAGADDLAAATTGAIRDLLALLRRLTESARRPITRASELVVLARWFRRLPDDGAAAELFDAAFGLGRPLHLSEAEVDPERTPSVTSWWTAPPVAVPITLREHGKRASPGRPGKASDYAATKARLAAEHRAGRAARAEAAARLVARPVEGRVLSDAELTVLLELLDRAAHQRAVGSQPGSDRPVVIEGASAMLTPDPAGMVVRTGRGALTLDGHRLVLAPAVAAAAASAAEAAS
ncbi:MAG: TIGR02677 family protein [Iamia sp.]